MTAFTLFKAAVALNIILFALNIALFLYRLHLRRKLREETL